MVADSKDCLSGISKKFTLFASLLAWIVRKLLASGHFFINERGKRYEKTASGGKWDNPHVCPLDAVVMR